MVTEAVTCARCNAMYPEGEPHACVSRWSIVLWWFGLAFGITLWLVGGIAGWVWYVLAQGSFDDSPFSVITIVGLGSGLLIVIGLCLARFRKR